MVVSALDVATRSAGYQAIARDGGGFAMVALDQRGSLEMLFRDAGLDPTRPRWTTSVRQRRPP